MVPIQSKVTHMNEEEDSRSLCSFVRGSHYLTRHPPMGGRSSSQPAIHSQSQVLKHTYTHTNKPIPNPDQLERAVQKKSKSHHHPSKGQLPKNANAMQRVYITVPQKKTKKTRGRRSHLFDAPIPNPKLQPEISRGKRWHLFEQQQHQIKQPAPPTQ
jgi:hypothetical protein